jgi:hypothetical protein
VTQTRRNDWIAVAVLTLVATLFFADVFAGRGNFYMRDLTRYYYPTKQILREIVQNGEFPWWNRQFSAGQPIAANPEHEVFYPLTWLILLPSYDLGYRLHILVHIYIGLLGAYALLRSMRVGIFAASIGALAFGLGGIYLSYINLLPILFCAAWLPLTCLYVRRFLLRPNVRDYALAALFLGLQFLVGEPTTVMQTGFLLGMYAMYRGWYAAKEWGFSWSHAVPEMLSRVVFIGLISIAAIAMGAAQMLPAIDHVGDSARSRTFDFGLVSAWSFPWAKFAELIYPNFLGHMSVNRVTWYWAGGLYTGMGSPFIFSIYSGLLITALAVGAFFVKPRGGRFVLLLCTFSLLIALGGNTPVLRWLYDAGIATSIRYPEKFSLIALFAIILFAAKLLDRMLDGDDGIREAAMGFVAATTLVAVVFALFGFTPLYEALFTKLWGLKGAGATLMTEMSHKDWLVAAARGAILFLLLWSLRRIRKPVWMALLGVFFLADLLPVMHELNPRMPSEFFTKTPPAVRHFAGDRTRYRVFHEADWYGQEEPARQYFSTGEAVYWIVRNGIFPMTPAGHDLQMVMERDYDKTALLPTIDYTDSIWDVKRSGRADWWKPFVAMANVGYRGIYRPFKPEKERVKGKMKTAEPIQFLAVDPQPRYYFADQLVQIRDRKDFVRKLIDGSYSASVAFVQEKPFVPGRGVVHRWTETANTARIDVESQGTGYLVMSVTPHKYWTITIDGAPVQSNVTNIAFQGIQVPPGKHVVEMRYHNSLAVTGMGISSVTVVMLLGMAFWPRRRTLATP